MSTYPLPAAVPKPVTAPDVGTSDLLRLTSEAGLLLLRLRASSVSLEQA